MQVAVVMPVMGNACRSRIRFFGHIRDIRGCNCKLESERRVFVRVVEDLLCEAISFDVEYLVRTSVNCWEIILATLLLSE